VRFSPENWPYLEGHPSTVQSAILASAGLLVINLTFVIIGLMLNTLL